MIRLLFLYLFIFTLSGCSAPSKPKAQDRRNYSPPQGPNTNQPNIIRDLEVAILDTYERIALGESNAFRSRLSAKEGVILVPLLPAGFIIGKNATSLFVDNVIQWFYRNKLGLGLSGQVLSKNLSLNTSPQFMAWTFDEVSLRSQIGNRLTTSIPVRFTSAFIQKFNRFEQVLMHTSYGLPFNQIFKMELAPYKLTIEKFDLRKSKITNELQEVIRRIHTTTDSSYRNCRLSAASDSAIIWPNRQEFHGEQIREAPRLLEGLREAATVIEHSVSPINVENIHVFHWKDSAWAYADLNVRISPTSTPPQSKDALSIDKKIHFRATYIFNQRSERDKNACREGRIWKIVQMHLSVPITVGNLNEIVRGSP